MSFVVVVPSRVVWWARDLEHGRRLGPFSYVNSIDFFRHGLTCLSCHRALLRHWTPLTHAHSLTHTLHKYGSPQTDTTPVIRTSVSFSLAHRLPFLLPALIPPLRNTNSGPSRVRASLISRAPALPGLFPPRPPPVPGLDSLHNTPICRHESHAITIEVSRYTQWPPPSLWCCLETAVHGHLTCRRHLAFCPPMVTPPHHGRRHR